MELIKQLKTKLNDAKKEEQKFGGMKIFRNKILSKKKEADNIHSEIQKLAIEGSNIFENLAKMSKEIDAYKEERLNVNSKIKVLNIQIISRNQDLSNLLKNWSYVSSKIQEDLVF